MSYTGAFCWTNQQANTAVVNNKCCLNIKEYLTTVKGEPCNLENQKNVGQSPISLTIM